MKNKCKTAWLITWEGPESEHNGKCKVVAVLPPQFGERSITSMLPFFYCSEYNFTLCEKMGFSTPNRKDPFFKIAYRDINPEFWYGHFPQEYLCARKVKTLRCEESEKDCHEATLYWTELAKYLPKQVDPAASLPDNPSDWLNKVRDEIDVAYTYLTRVTIAEEKRGRARRKG